jgi:hypothetical protein
MSSYQFTASGAQGPMGATDQFYVPGAIGATGPAGATVIAHGDIAGVAMMCVMVAGYAAACWRYRSMFTSPPP